jgi:fumarylacetoacetase
MKPEFQPDETHDPHLESWVTSANNHTEFPIQNLPWGVFSRHDRDPARVGVAIGDFVLDVPALNALGVLNRTVTEASRASTLNPLIALGRDYWHQARLQLSRFLRADHPRATEFRERADTLLHPINEMTLFLPVTVGDYTDFYASRHHALNIGKLFRPNNPLLPNYDFVPIAYHGRASSLVVSGTPVRRPVGQIRPNPDEPPLLAPTQRLDYELELGFIVGKTNPLGEPISVTHAADHLFGVVLLNDWSARDVQAWEYQPLGPFLSKNFATSLSPWVVTMEALAPYRCAATPHDTAPLAYLLDTDDQAHGNLDVHLEVHLETPDGSTRLSASNYRHMFWTPAQMIAHHTVAGCHLRVGDLLGSGTVSGPMPDTLGCLHELTQGGRVPIGLQNGTARTYLEDGDSVILRGFCQSNGFARLGFGLCRGTILPARTIMAE